MPKNFASASCNKNCLVQKITATTEKLQRHFALRKGKLHTVRTKFTKQENGFCPSLRILPRKTAFCKNYCKQRKTTTTFCFAERQTALFPHKIHKTKTCFCPSLRITPRKTVLCKKFTANNGKLQRHFALRKGKLHFFRTKFTKQKLAFTVFKRLPRKNDFAR